ncbi:MAG: DinB family protein [Terriglobales bacterium]
MKLKLVGVAWLWFLMNASMSFAQALPEGVFKGYAGEWDHVSEQLIALAEATPQDKFTWRPAAGVRSTSEVYMHIVRVNFLLLSATGLKMPSDFKDELVTTVTAKADVLRWLKRSLEAVKEAHAAEKTEDLQRKVRIFNTDATVDGMFLRIIIHNNEHMGQLVAYARMTGVVPPWSKS